MHASDMPMPPGELTLRDALIASGVPASRLGPAELRARHTGEHLSAAVVAVGAASHEQAARALADANAMQFLAADELSRLDWSLVADIEITDPNEGIPLTLEAGRLVIAVSDPHAQLSPALAQYPIKQTLIASKSALRKTYQRVFSRTAERYQQCAQATREFEQRQRRSTEADEGVLYERQFLALLKHACYAGANDVQLARSGDVAYATLVIDGVGTTFDVYSPDTSKRFFNLVTECSTVAQSSTAVFRDAGFKDEVTDRDFDKEIASLREEFDFRISLSRPRNSEALVIRILRRDTDALDLAQLGFDDEDMRVLRRAMDSSSGLIAVTGPTGSGKTTTRYALLCGLDPESKSIQTIENPVEYQHPMWLQYQVPSGAEEDNVEAIFKGLLRNAPKVIDIAEIRTAGVARTAMRAASTGHLVMCTLHTDDAAMVVYTLRLLGLTNEDLANNLQVVIGVRLMRQLCKHCRVASHRAEDINALKRLMDDQGVAVTPPTSIFSASDYGCSSCRSGYQGRFLVYELLSIQGELVQALRDNADTDRIRHLGIKPDKTLRGKALLHVAAGRTSIAEFNRVMPRGRG
ncbi:MAG: GspE/PulE family protein [Burkholderiales bacterium]